MSSQPNALIHSTSPYLLQHAYNPVQWREWSEEAMTQAAQENKLLLVSIGYSACHWCHVMERECFEDALLAQVMNENYICIKVDREERPDVDRIYMEAVQQLTGSGGWPLNCFALPDGRPVWGGTYFSPQQWESVLRQMAKYWQTEPQRVINQAIKLSEAIAEQDDFIALPVKSPITQKELAEAMLNTYTNFDLEWGGTKRAPKFPVPALWQYVSDYAMLVRDPKPQAAWVTTLDRMAQGGIFDQLLGGFARYSVDSFWRVPHFEKMLYDNAQLVSLYSKAYARTPKPLYKSVVLSTLDFIERELTDQTTGGFFSALDADSEGMEGKFYCWDAQTLKTLLGEDARLFMAYFSCTEAGNFEHGLNVLHRSTSDADFCKEHALSEQALSIFLDRCYQKLIPARQSRVRPHLDDKVITAWNALMIRGYIDAYLTFGNNAYLEAAIKNEFFLSNALVREGRLLRTYKAGKAHINAFAEDYAYYIDALIGLYTATGQVDYLKRADLWMQYSFKHFFDGEAGMFHFTSDEDKVLITRGKELYDSVMPSSNAVFAHNLLTLGTILDNPAYINTAQTMLSTLKAVIIKHSGNFGCWASAQLRVAFKPYEVVVMGKDALAAGRILAGMHLPNVIVVVSETPGSYPPILAHKLPVYDTTYYVCSATACHPPVNHLNEVLALMQ